MMADGIREGVLQAGALADPDDPRGAVEVEPLAREPLALAAERPTIGIVADQHMGEKA